MATTNTVPIRKDIDLISPLIAAMLIVLFLFFIDEGYYDFRWMKEWGNWFVFGIYLLIFFPVQWLISHFLFRQLTGWKKIIAMVSINVPLIIGLMWIFS